MSSPDGIRCVAIIDWWQSINLVWAYSGKCSKRWPQDWSPENICTDKVQAILCKGFEYVGQMTSSEMIWRHDGKCRHCPRCSRERKFAMQALELSRQGLMERCMGEEKFLDPLDKIADSGKPHSAILRDLYNTEWSMSVDHVYSPPLSFWQKAMLCSHV